jgi:hypothetical protein
MNWSLAIAGISARRAQEVVNITSQDHPDLAGRLSTLGNKHQSRFERTGRMKDLEESIRRAQEAVDIIPQDHPNMPAILVNLGIKLHMQFERTGRTEESIR